MTLAPAIVDEVKRLLGQSLTRRAVAKRISVSHDTVNLIANGKRPEQAEMFGAEGPYVRCPGCGGKQQIPCRVCRTRSQMKRG